MKRHLLIGALSLCASCASGLNEGDYRVCGSVKCAGEPIEGVIVTDGYNFAKSNRRGKFDLIVTDSSKFVTITTPAGYTTSFSDGVPDFYQRVSDEVASYDFSLDRWGEADSYKLIAIGDIQCMTTAHFERFRDVVFPDIKAQVEAELANDVQPVLVTLGDITWDNFDLYSQYVELIGTLPAPLYPVIGNHDHDKESKGDSESAHSYNDYFGPEYYAFNIGRDYYIVLDNIIYDTQKKYIEAISESQQDWIDNYLKFIPEGANIYACMHSPIMSYGDILDESYQEWVPLFEKYNLSVISGHTHLLFNEESLPGIFEHNVGAACGVWWTAETGQDGAPIGYQIFESNGEGKASWRYKSVGHDMDYQIKLYDQTKEDSNSVIAYIWAADDDWSVEGSFDGAESIEGVSTTMTNPDYDLYVKSRGGVPSYKKSWASDYYFAFDAPAGAKNFSVKATDRFGNVYEQSIEL